MPDWLLPIQTSSGRSPTSYIASNR